MYVYLYSISARIPPGQVQRALEGPKGADRENQDSLEQSRWSLGVPWGVAVGRWGAGCEVRRVWCELCEGRAPRPWAAPGVIGCLPMDTNFSRVCFSFCLISRTRMPRLV